MNVVNLSIGGPDYLDQPFVEKVTIHFMPACMPLTILARNPYSTLLSHCEQIAGLPLADCA